jgi:hypothetical protein
MNINWDLAGNWATVALTAISIFFGYIAWRVSENNSRLRRDDVLDWVKECIENLQTLLVKLTEDSVANKASGGSPSIDELALKITVLAEQGRLFFRNKSVAYGTSKYSAYRGFRPLILDQLIIAYKVARSWQIATEEEKYKLCLVAEDCVKQFVSLAQREVGRVETVDKYSSSAGNSIDLTNLLNNVADVQTGFEKLRKSHLP